ncbi:MAG TPA: response regulator [Anaerolineales bacterium]|nr:response regulator [Anaerolineales bacterium]
MLERIQNWLVIPEKYPDIIEQRRAQLLGGLLLFLTTVAIIWHFVEFSVLERANAEFFGNLAMVRLIQVLPLVLSVWINRQGYYRFTAMLFTIVAMLSLTYSAISQPIQFLDIVLAFFILPLILSSIFLDSKTTVGYFLIACVCVLFVSLYRVSGLDKILGSLLLLVMNGGLVILFKYNREILEKERLKLLEDSEARSREKLENAVAERTTELQNANLKLALEVNTRRQAEEDLEIERKMLAQRVDERTLELSNANHELAQTARMKDEFLASMSHELRTPLTGILGVSEALEEGIYGDLNQEQLDAIKTIEQSGSHLLDLINDVLDVAKIGSGTLQLDITSFSLDEVCSNALNLVRPIAQEKHLKIVYAMDGAVQTLQGDARRVKQILVNLLSNAVKFTEWGGEVGLEVQGDADEQLVRIMVWDNGIGIVEEDQHRLFKPFIQLDGSLSRKHTGTGLGLAIVYNFVQLHGGSIALESQPNVGTRFIVSLPWNPTQLSDLVTMPFISTAQGYGQRALIIEDSKVAANQFARYLTDLGLSVSIETHGRNAVERVLQNQCDIVILDVLLPDVSGWSVLNRLKADPRTSHIPVIIVSVVRDIAHGISLGAHSYLIKPIKRNELYEAIYNARQAIYPRQENVLVVADPDQLELDTSQYLPKILLVDDNESSLTFISDFLATRSFNVLTAQSGYQALEIARTQAPSLILMDIQMPGMDGLETIRRLRDTAGLETTPIIALTALVMPGDRSRCLAAGANDYLSKPIGLKKLEATIMGTLKSHHRLNESPRQNT